MTKFCSNCGAPLTDAAKFCNGCGSKQDAAPPLQQPQYQQPAPAAPKKKKSKKRLLIIVGVVLVAIVAIVSVYINSLLKEATAADYFESEWLNPDKIPTVKLALGEERKLTNVSISKSGSANIMEIKYDVPGTKQNEDMVKYLTYLRKEGFLVLTDIDFSGPSADGVVGCNSIESGYEIQLQIQYDSKGYTISIVKQPGGITPR